MPILQITPEKKTRQTQTILTDDLFQPAQINVSNIASGTTEYDNRFMQQVAAEQYGIDFDNLVSTYQETLQRTNNQIVHETNQQLANQDLYEQESRQISAEANKGLSTGTSAIVSQGITETVEQNKQDIIAKGQEASEKAAQTINEGFATTLESLFGKVDASGRFSNIIQYEQTAEYATTGMFKAIAASLFADDKTAEKEVYTKDGYLIYLGQKGLIEFLPDGSFAITDLGYQTLDEIVNSTAFGTNSESNIRKTYIDSMIDAELGKGAASELEFNNLEKYNKYFNKYETFIDSFASTWRYTSLGLWSGDETNPVIDMSYSVTEYKYSVAEFYSGQSEDDFSRTAFYFDTVATTVKSHQVFVANDKLTSSNTFNTSYSPGDNIYLEFADVQFEVQMSEDTKADLRDFIVESNLAVGTVLLVDGKLYIVTPQNEARGIENLWYNNATNVIYKALGLKK